MSRQNLIRETCSGDPAYLALGRLWTSAGHPCWHLPLSAERYCMFVWQRCLMTSTGCWARCQPHRVPCMSVSQRRINYCCCWGGDRSPWPLVYMACRESSLLENVQNFLMRCCLCWRVTYDIAKAVADAAILLGLLRAFRIGRYSSEDSKDVLLTLFTHTEVRCHFNVRFVVFYHHDTDLRWPIYRSVTSWLLFVRLSMSWVIPLECHIYPRFRISEFTRKERNALRFIFEKLPPPQIDKLIRL